MKNRIEQIRREQGILQEELAKMLGVSRQTISSLETGRYNPSITLAFKVARCFGMSIEEIFIYEGQVGRSQRHRVSHRERLSLHPVQAVGQV